MITAYHVTKTEAAFREILRTGVLLEGKNASTHEIEGVHISIDPFYPGSNALDVIGADTNRAWIFTFEVPEDTPLEPDPSGEGVFYNGTWMIHRGLLRVRIVSVLHISNVKYWEDGRNTALHEHKIF